MSLASNPADDRFLPGNFTLAQIVTTLDPAKNFRRYAWCTDLFGGGSPDWLISDGIQWKPVRPYGLQTQVAAGGGAISFTAMANAPTQIIDGVLGALGTNLTLSFSSQYAYRGAPFRIVRKATGVGALLVNGLGLALNSWSDHEWNGSAWVQTASGGLL